MKKIHVLMSLVLMLSFAGVSDAIVQPHEFLSGDCIMCHIDEKKAPEQIKSSVTDSCTKCHAKIDRTLGHPVDMYPYKNTVIPVDMPLTDRKVTCLTCHYVHPPEGEVNSTFIRREITGISFCLACHKNDSHVQPDKIDITGSFDEMTGRCIECHDMGRYFEWGGARSTCMSKLNHPVGVSYESTSNTRKGSFCPLQALSKEVNLFDGKIGCGTCHNIYSPMRNLLVMSNQQSKLCLQCHFECMGF